MSSSPLSSLIVPLVDLSRNRVEEAGPSHFERFTPEFSSTEQLYADIFTLSSSPSPSLSSPSSAASAESDKQRERAALIAELRRSFGSLGRLLLHQVHLCQLLTADRQLITCQKRQADVASLVSLVSPSALETSEAPLETKAGDQGDVPTNANANADANTKAQAERERHDRSARLLQVHLLLTQKRDALLRAAKTIEKAQAEVREEQQAQSIMTSDLHHLTSVFPFISHSRPPIALAASKRHVKPVTSFAVDLTLFHPKVVRKKLIVAVEKASDGHITVDDSILNAHSLKAVEQQCNRILSQRWPYEESPNNVKATPMEVDSINVLVSKQQQIPGWYRVAQILLQVQNEALHITIAAVLRQQAIEKSEKVQEHQQGYHVHVQERDIVIESAAFPTLYVTLTDRAHAGGSDSPFKLSTRIFMTAASKDALRLSCIERFVYLHKVRNELTRPSIEDLLAKGKSEYSCPSFDMLDFIVHYSHHIHFVHEMRALLVEETRNMWVQVIEDRQTSPTRTHFTLKRHGVESIGYLATGLNLVDIDSLDMSLHEVEQAAHFATHREVNSFIQARSIVQTQLR